LHSGPDNTIVNIQRGLRKVFSRSGGCSDYDSLLIATGSKPVMPAIPGVELTGVVSFRDIPDVETMLDYCQSAKHAVVLGGGLLGLEAASGLLQRGMDVTVIHNHAQLLNRQIDSHAAEMLQTTLSMRGMKFNLATQALKLIGNTEQHVQAVLLSDGSELPCDLFVIAIGVQPNKALAQQAGLYCERGIVVNDFLQTYDPCIYAVGECVQHRGQTFGLLAPVLAQARVCAHQLAGVGVAGYNNLPTPAKLKVSGVNFYSMGDFVGKSQSDAITYNDPASKVYKKLVIQDNKITGCLLYGDIADGPWYQELMECDTDVSSIRRGMIFGKAYQ
jgi:nitrite reductase (NADH) large subunit